MKYLSLIIILFLVVDLKYNSIAQQINTADSTSAKASYGRGFGILPLPGKTMLSFRSSYSKKWFREVKVGYTFSAIPQFNFELNALHRRVRNEILSYYGGIGVTLDGFTPGFIIPIGFEIKPFSKYPNVVIVTEASPKFTFSFSSAIYSTLQGNIGIIYYRPINKK